jgi:hypothetical protein
MEELWHTRLKDSFIKLIDFVESHKSSMPYDKATVEFITQVALLKRAEPIDLKKAMHEIVVGTSTYDGKQYPNIELMKGLEPGRGGFIIHESSTGKNLSGPFMKSNFALKFLSKQRNMDGVVLPITCEIHARSSFVNLLQRYTGDPKMNSEFKEAWFYHTSSLALSFVHFMKHYCLKDVSQDDRVTIENRIPKDCHEIKPLGNSPKMANIFKLAQNVSKNEYTKSMLGVFGVDPRMIEHLIGATQENVDKLDIEGLRNQALEAAQTGEIDGLGPTIKSLVSAMSHCMPSVDDGDPDEQD